MLHADIKNWEELLAFMSNSNGPEVSEKSFTLTEQFKCILSDNVLENKYMERYKNGQVIWIILFDHISYKVSLSKAFPVIYRHEVKLFLIKLNMAGEDSEHVIGLVINY